MDSLQEIMGKHHLQTIYELFLSQLISELLKQIRINSPFNVLGTSLMPNEVNNRWREKGLVPNQYSQTKLKEKSLKISFLKIYNWLLSANLIPYNLKMFSRYQIKNYLTTLNHNYVRKNRDLFHQFY